MKTILFVIATLIMTSNLYAQKGTIRLNLEGGMSAPSSDYGSYAYKNSNSLFATTGGNIEATLGYFILDNFSIDIMFNYVANGFDANYYYSKYFDNHGNSLAYDLTPKRLEYDAGSYYTNTGIYIGMGTHLLKGKNKKFIIQSKAHLGINIYTTPYAESILYYNDPTTEKQREVYSIGYGSGAAFSSLVSIGIGHKFSDRFGVYTNLEYVITKYNYLSSYEYAELNNSTTYYYEFGEYNQKSSVVWFNINLGAYFSFGKSKE